MMIRILPLLLFILAPVAHSEGFEYAQGFGAIASADCSGACQAIDVDSPVAGFAAGTNFGGPLGVGIDAMATDQFGALSLTISWQTAPARLMLGLGVGDDWGTSVNYSDARAEKSKSNDTYVGFLEAARGWGFLRLVWVDAEHKFRSRPILGTDGNGDLILGPRETLKTDVERWALFAGARFEF